MEIISSVRENTVRLLELSSRHIMEEEAVSLFRYLQANTSVTSITMYCNSIGDGGAAELASVLEKNPRITHVDIEENDIGFQGGGALAEAFARNPSVIRYLNLGTNPLGQETVVALATNLAHSTSLETLNLRSTDFSSIAEVQAIGRLVAQCAALTYLNLTGNYIGDEGALQLCAALKGNTSLATLILEDNDISAQGGVALAHSLAANNCSLSRLNLDDNPLGAQAGEAFLQALEHNTAVSELELLQCHIGQEVLGQIEAKLQANRAAQLEKRLAWVRVASLISVFRHCSGTVLKQSIHQLIPQIVELSGGVRRHHTANDYFMTEQEIADLDAFMATPFFVEQSGQEKRAKNALQHVTEKEWKQLVLSGQAGVKIQTISSMMEEEKQQKLEEERERLLEGELSLDSFRSLESRKQEVLVDLGLDTSELAKNLHIRPVEQAFAADPALHRGRHTRRKQAVLEDEEQDSDDMEMQRDLLSQQLRDLTSNITGSKTTQVNSSGKGVVASNHVARVRSAGRNRKNTVPSSSSSSSASASFYSSGKSGGPRQAGAGARGAGGAGGAGVVATKVRAARTTRTSTSSSFLPSKPRSSARYQQQQQQQQQANNPRAAAAAEARVSSQSRHYKGQSDPRDQNHSFQQREHRHQREQCTEKDTREQDGIGYGRSRGNTSSSSSSNYAVVRASAGSGAGPRGGRREPRRRDNVGDWSTGSRAVDAGLAGRPAAAAAPERKERMYDEHRYIGNVSPVAAAAAAVDARRRPPLRGSRKGLGSSSKSAMNRVGMTREDHERETSREIREARAKAMEGKVRRAGAGGVSMREAPELPWMKNL